MRKIIFWCHLALGVTVGCIILIIVVTGMLLAYRPQIINFAQQQAIQGGQEPGKNLPAKVFLKKVEAWHRWFGVTGPLQPVAHAIKKSTAFLFLIMILSGIFLWRPRRWDWKTFRQVTTFNGRISGKARYWNWHNVIGFWSAPFLTVIVATGLIMIFADAGVRKFAKSIHTGTAGGVVGQTIVFCACAATVVLVGTGFAMAWHRFQQSRRKGQVRNG